MAILHGLDKRGIFEPLARVFMQPCDRERTDKSIGKLFLVQPVHVDGVPHIFIGEEIFHHGSWQSQAVICIHPIILERLCVS